MTKPRLAALFLLGTLGLLGCGGGKGEVSGVVKFRGQPVTRGTISFFDERRGVWSSAIGSDGSYTVPQMPTGIAKITVTAPLAIGFHGEAPPNITPLPDKYADPNKSGLTYEVVSGSQTHPVDLE